MKTILLFSCFFLLLACSKKKDTTTNATGSYTFSATYNRTISPGQVVEQPQPLAFLFIWKADNRDFVIKTDISSGYAFDNISQTSIKYDIAIADPALETGELAPGRYFIYIVTGQTDFPRGMYSYTYFTIQAGQVTTLKKVFRDQNNFAYESW